MQSPFMPPQALTFAQIQFAQQHPVRTEWGEWTLCRSPSTTPITTRLSSADNTEISLEATYWGLNVCVPPKFLCCNPNAQYDGIRRWTFWKVIRSWEQSHECNCLYRRSSREIPCPFHYRRIQQNTGYDPGRWPHQNASMLAPLDFPVSKLWKINFCCF